MPAQRHVNYSLKPSVINAAKPQDKPFVLTDGGGLYIEVLPGGSKVWRYGGKDYYLTPLLPSPEK